MNVWIVNPFDNLPTEGYRPMRYWLMSQAFADAGDDVVCWTSDFSHANKKRRVHVRDVPRNFGIVELPTRKYGKNVSVSRLVSHYLLAKRFAKSARAAVGKGQPAPDLIVVSSPPILLAREVHRFARRVNAKVIVDVMDAWPETFERILPRFMLYPLRRIAERNYLSAAAITAVSGQYVSLVRSYGFEGPARTFYHGIELDGAVPETSRRSAPLRVVYVGSLGMSYDLSSAIEVFAGMKDSVAFTIAGKGEQEPSLKRLAASLGAGNVSFAGYLGSRELDALLASSDIGLVPMDKSSCVGIPYKFADYSKHGIAIVSSLEGESASLLKSYGAGAVYAPGDKASLRNAFADVASRLQSCRESSRRMAATEFDACGIYAAYRDFAVTAAGARKGTRHV